MSAIHDADLTRRFLWEGELASLVALARLARPRVMIEFGCHDGRTAKCMLRELHDLHSYVGVEVGAGYVPSKIVQRGEIPLVPGDVALGDDRFTLIVRRRGSFDLTSYDLPRADVIFIDGDHSRAGVINDTRLARALINPGGVIIWHDYHELPSVDVAGYVHDMIAVGHNIKHVEDTWIAFEQV